MSYQDPCRHCGQQILVARVRGGRWLPFDLNTIEATPTAVDAWVLDRRRGFVPIAEIAPNRLARHQRFARQHRCAQFMRWVAEKRYRTSSFSNAVGSLIDLWTKEEIL